MRANLVLLILNLLVIVGKGQAQSIPAVYQNLSAATYKVQLAKNKNILLLDVRTPEEFAKGHLEGAININFFDPDFKDKIKALDQAKPIYVYCAVGGRSGKTATLLIEMNYKEVYNLEGGFTAWQKANYPFKK